MTSAQTGTEPLNEFPRMSQTQPDTPPMNQSDITRISGEVQAASEPFRRLQREIHEVIVGQDQLLNRMIVGILANGHLLIEGVPGLAKTLAVSSLANGIDTSFQRLQFTPDLLPADVIGTLIYRQDTGEFVVNKGPVFANIVLADEINRAPAKVQSALLQHCSITLA